MNLDNNRGFTLIELLVVIAIIGILSAFGLLAVNDARESARDSRRVSDLAQLRLGLQLYFEDYKAYPAPVFNDGSGPNSGPDTSYGSNSELYAVDGTVFSDIDNPLVPAHIGQVLLDPFNSAEYHYFYDTSQSNGHQEYVLCFKKESVNYTSRYFHSSGIFAEGIDCPGLTLP